MARTARWRLIRSTVIIASATATFASAGVGVWTTNGPNGGGFGLVTNPQVPGIVFTGGDSGLFVSKDNGASWTATAQLGGGPFGPLAVGQGTTVYASGPFTGQNAAAIALFASADEGEHWSTVTYGDFGTSYVLAADPVTPSILYLVTNFQHGPVDVGGLSRSADGGSTWTSIGAGLEKITNIVVAPSVPSTLYAATTGFFSLGLAPGPISSAQSALPVVAYGLSKSVDSGSTWVLLTDSLQNVMCLSVDPGNESTVYAATASSGVLKSVDGGVTFTPANNGLASTYVQSLVIDPHNSNRVYAATGAGVFSSSDGATSWETMNTGLSALDSIRDLTIDATGQFLHVTTGSDVFDFQMPDRLPVDPPLRTPRTRTLPPRPTTPTS